MVSLSGLLMLELATAVPELEDSANAAPLLASVVAKVLMLMSLMLMLMVSVSVLVPSVTVTVSDSEEAAAKSRSALARNQRGGRQ